ncbi:hypothetical protein BDZ89DRAFT_1136873 [Hymenopellis radicata]|nr:hypothetical protein BDZ89DRAFT_1136873 [Hymenopellis radicata]
MTRAHLPVLLALLDISYALYAPVREYAGKSFFDGWDFPGTIDNTTWGNVTFVDHATATSDQLAFVNTAGNAVLRVDNVSVVSTNALGLAYRNSVKIKTQDVYPLGSLITADITHMPFGCSVWPSFWTLGGTDDEWPMYGEIDIIEGVNQMTSNQMALHTNISTCVQSADAKQLGSTVNAGCADEAGTVGCRVTETKPDSFGTGFNQAGGGVFALQFDVSGAFIWFWSRANIPASITGATSTSTMDTADWGLPSASYPATGCNLEAIFKPQKLILDITLCGNWAGVPSLFSSSCTGECVPDWVLGAGSGKYDDAFFEIAYVRTDSDRDLLGHVNEDRDFIVDCFRIFLF